MNYFQHFDAFLSAVSGNISTATSASLVGVPVGIVSVAVRLRTCGITAIIKIYKSIIEEKNEKYKK